MTLVFFHGEPGRGPLLLVVEDHADTRAMYVEYLSQTFLVEEAATAHDGLEIARRRPPDLVVTDLSLPGMDGLELVQAMRQDTRLRDVPAICLSGYGAHTYEARAREVGCELLQKPCLPDELAAHVKRLLRRPSRNR